MEKRGEQYYVSLAQKVLDNNGICTRERLVELVWKTDEEFGMTKSKFPKNQVNRFIELLRGYIEQAQSKKEDSEKRGVGIKRTTTLYSINLNTIDEIKSIFSKQFARKIKRNPNYSLTEKDISKRDRIVKLSKELEKEDPSMTRTESIKKAKTKLPRVETVKKILRLFNRASQLTDNIVESSWIKEAFGQFCTKTTVLGWIKALENGGTRLSVQIIDSNVDRRSWAIKFRDIQVSRLELNILAEAVGLKVPAIQNPVAAVINTPKPKRIKENNSYLVFAIAAIILANNSSTMSTVSISSILRNNNYNPIETNDHDLLEIAKEYDNLFDKPNYSRKQISLIGNRDKICEILKKLNPANQPWNIGWCINSGLELSAIKEIFPDSYIDHEEVSIGSKIVIVKADRGILSKIKLTRLQKLMRSCDFPIGMEKGFVEYLKTEGLKLDKRFENYLVGNGLIDKFRNYSENDQILLRIEQSNL